MKTKMIIMTLMLAAFSMFAKQTKTEFLTFSRSNFQLHNDTAAVKNVVQATVPIVYKGSITCEEITFDACNAEEECLTDEKLTIKLYMTMCQPCIDCRPCERIDGTNTGIYTATDVPAMSKATNAGAGKLTVWNLYTIEKFKKDDGTWSVAVVKLPLNAGGPTLTAWFFTGSSSGKAALVGSAEQAGGYKLAQFTGSKNNYTFKYQEGDLVETGDPAKPYEWTNISSTKSTAHIKSISSMSGTLHGYASNGTTMKTYGSKSLKLTRDGSLTKKFIERTFKTVKIFHDQGAWACIPSYTEYPQVASYCENVLTNDTANQDAFDKYLVDEVIAKSYKNCSISDRSSNCFK